MPSGVLFWGSDSLPQGPLKARQGDEREDTRMPHKTASQSHFRAFCAEIIGSRRLFSSYSFLVPQLQERPAAGTGLLCRPSLLYLLQSASIFPFWTRKYPFFRDRIERTIGQNRLDGNNTRKELLCWAALFLRKFSVKGCCTAGFGPFKGKLPQPGIVPGQQRCVLRVAGLCFTTGGNYCKIE